MVNRIVSPEIDTCIEEIVIHNRTSKPDQRGSFTMLLSHFSSVRLCDRIDVSPSGSPVPGILQARTLEWVAISFSSAWKWKVKVKLLSCVRLSDPMHCSLPGSSLHGIIQARVLEWGAIAFSEIYNKWR